MPPEAPHVLKDEYLDASLGEVYLHGNLFPGVDVWVVRLLNMKAQIRDVKSALSKKEFLTRMPPPLQETETQAKPYKFNTVKLRRVEGFCIFFGGVECIGSSFDYVAHSIFSRSTYPDSNQVCRRRKNGLAINLANL